MKSIYFNDNAHTVEVRDVTELISSMSTDSRFDKFDVTISYRDTVPDVLMMTRVSFDVMGYNSKSKEYLYYVYTNFRGHNFCCQNKQFVKMEHLADAYKDYNKHIKK